MTATVTLAPTADLRTVPGPDRLFELLAPFTGTINAAAFTIPAGFLTDFASVPKLFQNIVTNNDPDILRPSLVHDWLYQSGGEPPYSNLKFTRAEADQILRAGMIATGATWIRRTLVWAAVRLGGATSWRTANLRRAVLRSDYKFAMRLQPHIRPK